MSLAKPYCTMNKMRKIDVLNFIKKHQYYIGFIAILVSFIIVRLPYFLYTPFPFINGDGHQYYNILNLIEEHSQIKIGFPGIGYLNKSLKHLQRMLLVP